MESIHTKLKEQNHIFDCVVYNYNLAYFFKRPYSIWFDVDNLLFFNIIFASFFSSDLTMILIDNICSIVPHHFILNHITFYITLVDQCARTKLYKW